MAVQWVSAEPRAKTVGKARDTQNAVVQIDPGFTDVT